VAGADAVVEVTREQALAFRVAGHHLHERTDPLTAVTACGLQEFPPGHAAVAWHARAGEVAEDDPVRDVLVTVNAMRGSPYVVPRADVAVFTTALVPEDDDDLRGLIGSAPAKEVREAGLTVREALDLVAAAAREGLAAGPLGRDDFHQALRERLPDGLLPWCRGCRSHHVRPALWRALGPLGVTEMPEKAVWALAGHGAVHPSRGGRASGAAGTSPPPDLAEARRELARRFLRTHGPASHGPLAAWAQTAPSHAKALFAALEDELARSGSTGRGAGSSPPTSTASATLPGRRASACCTATTPTSHSPTARRSSPTTPCGGRSSRRSADPASCCTVAGSRGSGGAARTAPRWSSRSTGSTAPSSSRTPRRRWPGCAAAGASGGCEPPP
jgi:hypothetical protein